MDHPKDFLNNPYKEGFESPIESDSFDPGLSEEVIVKLSRLKKEPEWLLNFRLDAYKKLLKMSPPTWGHLKLPYLNLQDMSYHVVPKNRPNSLEEVDPEIINMFNKLGIPLHERAALAGVAIDAVVDSTSVATTFKKRLEKIGVLFCSFGEAVHVYPELIQKYLASVVPVSDNYYACLNSAVFSDGSFVYIPKGVRCPMDLSTYFRINSKGSGQFERTLIIADEDSEVSYLEGCTAVARSEQQLHAAVVEIVAHKGSKVRYATVQNWYPGNEKGEGGILNFVTKRAIAHERAFVSWTQVETGSAITWKYPSVVLRGDDSVGEFYSVAMSNHFQQADTGTKMIHLGKNTKSIIVSKGISAKSATNTYRGKVRFTSSATGAKNNTTCDSLIIGNYAAANTYPVVENMGGVGEVEHEASTSTVSDELVLYLKSRGLSEEQAVELIVAGFCQDVIEKLPMEFAVEAKKLLGVSMEGAIG